MKKIFFIFTLLVCALVFCPGLASAADTLGQGMLSDSVEGLGLESDLESSLANIISSVLAIVGTMFLVLTVAAGIMWMTAAGNEERIGKAKQILVGAVIGLIISLSAYTITYFVTKVIGGSGGNNSDGSNLAAVCCTIEGVKSIKSAANCEAENGSWSANVEDCK